MRAKRWGNITGNRLLTQWSKLFLKFSFSPYALLLFTQKSRYIELLKSVRFRFDAGLHACGSNDQNSAECYKRIWIGRERRTMGSFGQLIK